MLNEPIELKVLRIDHLDVLLHVKSWYKFVISIITFKFQDSYINNHNYE